MDSISSAHARKSGGVLPASSPELFRIQSPAIGSGQSPNCYNPVPLFDVQGDVAFESPFLRPGLDRTNGRRALGVPPSGAHSFVGSWNITEASPSWSRGVDPVVSCIALCRTRRCGVLDRESCRCSRSSWAYKDGGILILSSGKPISTSCCSYSMWHRAIGQMCMRHRYFSCSNNSHVTLASISASEGVPMRVMIGSFLTGS